MTIPSEKSPLLTTSTLTPPLPTATPNTVRTFLSSLLVATRNLPTDHANSIAEKWRLGTGRELSTYPPNIYADIFGAEDGWMVYKETQLLIRSRAKEEKKRERELKSWAWIIAIVMVEVVGTTCSLALQHPTAKGAAILVTAYVGIVALMVRLIKYRMTTSLEVQIERELHEGMGRKKCT